MSIELVNLRKEKPAYPWDIKVDRSSSLGNPFKDKDRASQCDRYEITFLSRVQDSPEMVSELKRLFKLYRKYGKIRLFCWCVPKQCHSETIKRFLELYIQLLKETNHA